MHSGHCRSRVPLQLWQRVASSQEQRTCRAPQQYMQERPVLEQAGQSVGPVRGRRSFSWLDMNTFDMLVVDVWVCVGEFQEFGIDFRYRCMPV